MNSEKESPENYKNIIDKLQEDVEGLKTRLVFLTDASFELIKNQLAANQRELEATQKELDETKSRLETTQTELSSAKTELENFRTEFEAANSRIYELERTTSELDASLEKIQTEIGENHVKPPLPTDEKYRQSESEYYYLVAFPPQSESASPRQWLHKSSVKRCEGKIQIGDNGSIRCERCQTQMPILEWYIVDESHLSEEQFNGRQIDTSDAESFAGQIIPIAGKEWMKHFLTCI